MDLSENRIFFTEVAMVHFPALNTYLSQASSNVLKTIDAWQETLRDVTTQEALSVMHRWTRDELPRPAYFELADFALHLRAVVLRDRADGKKAQILDQIKDRQQGTTGNYSHVSLRPFIDRVLDSGERCKRGEITLEEHYATRDEVLKDLESAQRKSRY